MDSGDLISAGSHEVTRLLRQWAGGDPQARDELMPLVYQELYRVAARFLRDERSGHTLEPAALVHEAYIRLVDQNIPTWQNRSHFFGVAAHLMRQILVDHARRRQAGKRAGRKVSLQEAVSLSDEHGVHMLALDAALGELEKFDARKCQTVELHYFGGFTTAEIAQAQGVSPVTVRRDLRMAETWLCREMSRLE